MTTEQIILAVATLTGIPASAITGPRRTSAVIIARTLTVAAIAQTFSFWSLSDIAAVFGHDHCTVIHTKRRHANLLATDRVYTRLWHQLQTNLSATTA
jgi:chromosomal replication initiation ATPase DnaA